LLKSVLIPQAGDLLPLRRYYGVREGLHANIANSGRRDVHFMGALAQQQPCNNPRASLLGISERMNPAIAAQRDFEHAACEYRNCVMANPNNQNACEGLRHIMDATAQAAGHYR
jgi:hypothetical protein